MTTKKFCDSCGREITESAESYWHCEHEGAPTLGDLPTADLCNDCFNRGLQYARAGHRETIP